MLYLFFVQFLSIIEDRRGRDRIVVGFTTLSMQSVPITTGVVSSNLDQGEVYNIIDKVCQWLTSGRWFSPGTPVSSTNKTDRRDIVEILLKVALSTIKLTTKNHYMVCLSTHAPGVCGNHTHHGGCLTCVMILWLMYTFYLRVTPLTNIFLLASSQLNTSYCAVLVYVVIHF